MGSIRVRVIFSEIDYDSVIARIQEKNKSLKLKLIGGLSEKTKKNGLVLLSKMDEKKLTDMASKFLMDRFGLRLDMYNLKMEILENGMLQVDATIIYVGYKALFDILERLIVRSDREYVRMIIPVVFSSALEDVPTEAKNHMLADVANRAPIAFYNDLMDILKEKTGILIRINEVRAEYVGMDE